MGCDPFLGFERDVHEGLKVVKSKNRPIAPRLRVILAQVAMRMEMARAILLNSGRCGTKTGSDVGYIAEAGI